MTDQERITLMLDSLHKMRLQRELLNTDKAAAVDAVLTPEIRVALADIECEYAPLLATADFKIAELESAVKDIVVKHGETVRGTGLMAVWNKPRISWNDAALNGYAVDHPEIQQFRKVGDPSVTIRQM